MKMFFLKKISAITLLLVTTSLATSQPVVAKTVVTTIAGNSCFPINGEAVTRGPLGIYMSGYYPASVACPITTDNAPWTGIDIEVNGFSGNPENDPLSCTLMITDQNGNPLGNFVATLDVDCGTGVINGVPQQICSPPTYGDAGSSLASASTNLSVICHLPGVPSIPPYSTSYLTMVTVSKNE